MSVRALMTRALEFFKCNRVSLRCNLSLWRICFFFLLIASLLFAL